MRAVAQVLYLYSPLLVTVLFTGLTLRFDLFPALKRPIDGGATFRGRRVFGATKTWRIVAVTVIGCVAVVAVQKYLGGARAGWLALGDYATANPPALGAAIGGGAPP